MPTADELVSDVSTRVAGMSLASLAKLAVTIVVGIVIIRILMQLVDRALARSSSLGGVKKYIRSILKIILWAILVLIVAGSLGIEVTSLIALFSVAGLAVSLAMQNTLSNLAGGILILITKPFEPGNYVSIDGTEGTVLSTSLAYTALTTIDNKEIFIPNSQIASAKITNFNRLGKRRIDMTFTASYDAPTETVKTAIGEVVSGIPQIMSDPAPVVYLTDYGNSSISYQVRVWCTSDDYWTVYFGLKEGVRPAFKRHNVEMTYDHLNVHVIEQR